MLVKRPRVYDKPLTLFKLENEIALHLLQSKLSTNAEINTIKETEKLIIPLRGFVEFHNLVAEEKDIIYVPRGIDRLRISFEAGSIIYVVEAPSSIELKPYIKKFKDAKYVDVGHGYSRRRRYILVDVDDKSSRFLAGYTMGYPGCWGSYPPHKHNDKYEVFVYFGVNPGFGVQLLIDDGKEEAYVVRDYDVFLVTRGYHPNVSTPLKGLNYLWVMIAVGGSRDFSMEVYEKDFASL